MEKAPAFVEKYPPIVVAVLSGAAFGLIFLAVVLFARTQRPLLAYSFVIALALVVGLGGYRRAQYAQAGVEPIPPIIQSLPLHLFFMSLLLGVYGGVASLIIEQPGESHRMAAQMTVFGLLMGIAMTYRQRRWPSGTLWYDVGAAASVVVASIALTPVIKALF